VPRTGEEPMVAHLANQAIFDFGIFEHRIQYLKPLHKWLMKKTLYTQQYAILLTMLKEARAKVGLTQSDIAKKMRMSQSDVSKCELGQRRLDVIELKLWVEILGDSLAGFLADFESRLPANVIASPRKVGGARRE
jgi:DNA-binding transcriptional regulator YiaG